jgi:hypothetical protein
MAGRGSQTFQKRQKEQNRKEKAQEKRAKRMEKKLNPGAPGSDDDMLEPLEIEPFEGTSSADPMNAIRTPTESR